MTTFPSDDEEIITNDDEPTIVFTRSEIAGLLKECRHSYISYENPIAMDVVRRMMKFADDELDTRSNRPT